MMNVSDLIVCSLCGRRGPAVDPLVALPVEQQVAALGSGWRFDEEDTWMCPQCLDTQLPVPWDASCPTKDPADRTQT